MARKVRVCRQLETLTELRVSPREGPTAHILHDYRRVSMILVVVFISLLTFLLGLVAGIIYTIRSVAKWVKEGKLTITNNKTGEEIKYDN